MLQTSIIPAIIPQSLAHLFSAIEKLGGVAGEIQIDIVDGVFVRDTSWPYLTLTDGNENKETSVALFAESMPRNLSYELDLMIAEPLRMLPIWLAKYPAQIVLHMESFATDEDIMRAIEMIREAGSKVVLASSNDTPLERLHSFVSQIDGIQCMGIAEIGRQGSEFDMRVLSRIQTLRQAYPALLISVDGSVNAQTIMSLKVAGANRFVIGSAIFNTVDPVRAYKEFELLVAG